jgi:alkaline phosphatase
MNTLLRSKNYKIGDYTQVSNKQNMQYNIVQIMNDRTCFGFTSGSHTGEEVFLAAYHPKGDIPTGALTNIEINNYLCKVSGLENVLPDLTKRIFSKHTDVLSGLEYAIDTKDEFPVLTVKKGNNILSVKAFDSVATINGTPLDLGSVTVYIDKNETFYLPSDILKRAKMSN